METLEKFSQELGKHRIIGVDSSVFIYQFEEHPQFGQFSSFIFEGLDAKKFQIVTSAVSASEVLVRPFTLQDIETVTLYEQVFEQLPGFTLAEIDYAVAKAAAALRAAYGIRLPDALQIAAAMKHHATLFVTNDHQLKKVKEIKVICMKDFLNKHA